MTTSMLPGLAPSAGTAPPARETLLFALPGIHCAGCIGKIERGLTPLPGVTEARVNLSLKRLSVSGSVAPGRIIAALADLGFEALALDLDSLGPTRDTKGRALLTRLAVAGFAMMNVMLLSVAVWSGASDATRDLFHLISAAIALPVVIYSGQPFFLNAWTALRVMRLNMDVPISLAIGLAAGLSLFEALNGGDHAYFDAALSLTFFLLIGRYLDHKTRAAARSAAQELTALEVHTAQRLRDGQSVTTPVTDLVAGDRILVPAGGRIPVDGTLLARRALLDRSLITGESAPVDLVCGATLQAGEVNLASPLEMRATVAGTDTSLRRMAALVETAETGRNSYTSLADRAAQVYAPAVHLLALAAFLGWAWATGDLRHALNIAIAVLIITCPCALGLAVPAVTTAAIGRLYGAGFLVKHATALERLAEVDHIVFDKTGTLTLPAVKLPPALPSEAKSVARALAQMSDHPLSRAVVAALPQTPPAALTDVAEVPGQGISALWNGRRARLGRGAWLGASFAGLGLQIGDAPPVAFEVPEALRPGVTESLAALDLPAEIVTGDAATPAMALGRRLGLHVTAAARPEDKLDRLAQLREQGHKVLMIGDGLNDTAALAAAHASLAPATALDAARNAADVVLLRESFAALPLVRRVAQLTVRLSQQNFAIAALYNAIAVPIALAGYATPLAAALAMSLSSLTVLLNAQRMRFAS